MKGSQDIYLNNHLIIKLYYHKESEYEWENFLEDIHLLYFFWRDVYRVVGFEVEPKSIDSKRIKVEQDGSCLIQNGQDMQKFNPKGWIIHKIYFVLF